MIWFVGFTSLGAAITLLLLWSKWVVRPTWRDWLSTAALLVLCTWLAQV